LDCLVARSTFRQAGLKGPLSVRASYPRCMVHGQRGESTCFRPPEMARTVHVIPPTQILQRKSTGGACGPLPNRKSAGLAQKSDETFHIPDRQPLRAKTPSTAAPQAANLRGSRYIAKTALSRVHLRGPQWAGTQWCIVFDSREHKISHSLFCEPTMQRFSRSEGAIFRPISSLGGHRLFSKDGLNVSTRHLHSQFWA
jgi:hypothetical protein